MKVLMTKWFLATRSNASKPCLSILELAGTGLPPCPSGLEMQTDEIGAKTSLFSRTFMPISRSPAWMAASDDERKSQDKLSQKDCLKRT